MVIISSALIYGAAAASAICAAGAKMSSMMSNAAAMLMRRQGCVRPACHDWKKNDAYAGYQNAACCNADVDAVQRLESPEKGAAWSLTGGYAAPDGVGDIQRNSAGTAYRRGLGAYSGLIRIG